MWVRRAGCVHDYRTGCCWGSGVQGNIQQENMWINVFFLYSVKHKEHFQGRSKKDGIQGMMSLIYC